MTRSCLVMYWMFFTASCFFVSFQHWNGGMCTMIWLLSCWWLCYDYICSYCILLLIALDGLLWLGRYIRAKKVVLFAVVCILYKRFVLYDDDSIDKHCTITSFYILSDRCPEIDCKTAVDPFLSASPLRHTQEKIMKALSCTHVLPPPPQLWDEKKPVRKSFPQATTLIAMQSCQASSPAN